MNFLYLYIYIYILFFLCVCVFINMWVIAEVSTAARDSESLGAMQQQVIIPQTVFAL